MRFHEDRMAKLVCSDGVSRDVHIWEAESPKAVFVAIHGGMAHAGDYCTPGLYFKEKGYATVSFDMVGHDRKEKVLLDSFETYLDDVALFIKWAKHTYPGVPLVMLGHSMGALILTHYGLRRLKEDDPLIKGFIFSSPYYVNAVKIPAVVEKLSGVLARLAPNATLPIDDFTEQLTHDADITARHKADAADHYRATAVSIRYGAELLKAQNYLPEHIGRWDHPLLVFIAGTDMLADAEATQNLLDKIDAELVTSHVYPDNYHENFNELNREEIFKIIDGWVDERL